MNKTQRDWSKVQRLKSPRQVNLRLSVEEMEQLDAIVKERGVSKAGYIKSRVFGSPISKASKRPKAFEADLRQLLGLLGKLGGNTNQIARLCNTDTLTDQQAADALGGIRTELAQMRIALLKALDKDLG